MATVTHPAVPNKQTKPRASSNIPHLFLALYAVNHKKVGSVFHILSLYSIEQTKTNFCSNIWITGTVKHKLGTKEDGAHMEPHGSRDRLGFPL